VPRLLSATQATSLVSQICKTMSGMRGCPEPGGDIDAPLWSLAELCRPGTGMPGMTQCKDIAAMCHGIPAQNDFAWFCHNFPGPNSHPADEPFCQGSTVMYMSGFQFGFESDTCPILLFPSWVLNTRTKYVVGLIGTVRRRQSCSTHAGRPYVRTYGP
jgi:hypothetical protein